MADIVDLACVRRERRAFRVGARDPERTEVFPCVSLADLWRLWALSDRARDPTAGTGTTIAMS